MRPYHAYSPSGTVTGAPAVYVNLGREEDYLALRMMGVEVRGSVAVVRRGKESRGGVVERAAAEGAVAVLMYTEGESLGGIERGTVMKGLGDPLTPGWGGVEGGEALDLEDSRILERFPKIPSMPISPEVAFSILGSLEGPQLPHHWRVDALVSQPSRVGPGPTFLNFSYQVCIFFLFFFFFFLFGFLLLIFLYLIEKFQVRNGNYLSEIGSSFNVGRVVAEFNVLPLAIILNGEIWGIMGRDEYKRS